MNRNMEVLELRKCASIKSRKQKGAPCPYTASNGDFCARHAKNPIRFCPKPSLSVQDRITTRAELQAARQLQTFWRRWSALAHFRRQGPAANDLSLSANDTEVYSLEDIRTIPFVFFFSFADSEKKIWGFDIRSLSHMVTREEEIQNPYNRQILSSQTLQTIHKRIVWLRERKYPILYATGENLTQEQIWNQKVLDVFFKMEALGYRASCRWFESMALLDHEDFYKELYTLWTHRLHLTSQEKEAIMPGYDSSMTKLFRKSPNQLQGGTHDLRWWRRCNLNLILDFLTRGYTKSQQSLASLYVLMALTQVVPEAAEAYPWIQETAAH